MSMPQLSLSNAGGRTSTILLSLFLSLQACNVNATSCNYATFSARTVYPKLAIGTFSLSTNRCQSLKAKLEFRDTILGFDLPFDGSLKLQCQEYEQDAYQIIVNLYDDPLCNDLIEFADSDSDSQYANYRDGAFYLDLDDNNQFTIYDSIRFSLDDMNCDAYQDDTSCGISLEMANNCSWAQSQRYLNISVPDSHCTTLAPDFGSVLSNIPQEIVPAEFAQNLQTSARKYQCCSADQSLLVSNYSDVTCSNEPDSQFRISSTYNGQCFVVGENEDVIDYDYYYYNWYDYDSYLDENSDSSFVFIMKWTCNEFVDDCSGIPMVDDTYMPQTCSEQCMLREHEQEAISNQGRSGAGSTALSEKTTKIVTLILVIVSVLAVFVIVLVGAALYGRRKALQNQMEGNMAANMNAKKVVASADKYKAFVSDVAPAQQVAADDDINVVHVEPVDAENTTVQ